MRLLFSSIHCYVAPSIGAVLCTRELLELLAARGADCRVLTTGILDPEQETSLDEVLATLELPARRFQAELGTCRAAEVIDLSINGVQVTLMPHDLIELSGAVVDASRRAGSSTPHTAGGFTCYERRSRGVCKIPGNRSRTRVPPPSSVDLTNPVAAQEADDVPSSRSDLEQVRRRSRRWRRGDRAQADNPPGGRGRRVAGGSLASFTGETDTLRRKRLLAAAVFLAATLGLLCSWVFASDNPGTLTVEGSRYSLRVGFIALRCVFAAVVAGLLASEVSLTRKQLRVVEYVLFLGLTLLLMASQYFVSLDLMRRGSEYMPIVLAFIKDAVIQMMALMMIYGTLIPNPPAVAARTLVAIFVIPVVSAFLRRFHPDVAPVVAQLGAAEEAGSNILFLGIGAALAISGAFLVNGLRTELHEARKLAQYQLGEKLGEGGMGEVYLAEHQLLKRPCALKLIKPDVNTNPIALARFEREVQSAAMLSHPNTIEIFDYGHTDDGTFYYVMEYLPGLSVSDLVRRSGPLPPGRAVYLMH